MTKQISKKICRAQLDKMADFMEKHPELFSASIDKIFTKKCKKLLWDELAAILNSERNGPLRTPDKWIKTFNDYKCYVKKKYQTYLNVKDPSTTQFSMVEARYIRLMGFNTEGLKCSDSYPSNPQYVMFPQVEEKDENEDLGEEIISEVQEEMPKFYQAPNIINLLPRPSIEKETPIEEESPSLEMSTENHLTSTPKHSRSGSTADALQAIAKQLGIKNKLTRRKLELEEEKLLLEKRKIEAFELIAKRLRKSDINL